MSSFKFLLKNCEYLKLHELFSFKNHFKKEFFSSIKKALTSKLKLSKFL